MWQNLQRLGLSTSVRPGLQSMFQRPGLPSTGRPGFCSFCVSGTKRQQASVGGTAGVFNPLSFIPHRSGSCPFTAHWAWRAQDRAHPHRPVGWEEESAHCQVGSVTSHTFLVKAWIWTLRVLSFSRPLGLQRSASISYNFPFFGKDTFQFVQGVSDIPLAAFVYV